MPISALKIWNDGEQLFAADLNAEFANTNNQAVIAASQSEVNAGIVSTKALTPIHNKIILGVPTVSTSGTSIDFSSIPAGTRRVDIHFSGVSTNGTNNILIQLGDSGGIETTGYNSAVSVMTTTVSTGTFTSGIGVTNGWAATGILRGVVTLLLQNASTNTWCASLSMGNSVAVCTYVGGGDKSLSGVLTSIRITTTTGVDTFDAGSINIGYER